jgi:hypothetical protein
MKRLVLAVVAAALVVGCGGERPPTSPIPQQPNRTILDGARGAGGNPDFFFLLPLALPPFTSPNFDIRGFDGTRSPTVQVCALTNGAIVDQNGDGLCDAPHRQFAGAQVRVQPFLQSYEALWRTDQPALDINKIYRIRVLLGNVELGFVDVDPVTRQQFRNALTGENIPVIEGWVIPIRFRIEKGVLASGNGAPAGYVEQVVPASGGTVRTPTTDAGAFFPPGWLNGVTLNGQPVTSAIVTIERVPVAPSNNCHLDQPIPGIIQYEGCFRYRTIPDLGQQQFGADVIVAMCPELSTQDPRYDALRLYKSDVDEPVTVLPPVIPPFALDCTQFAGTPPQIGASGLLDRVGAGFERFAANVGRFVTPRSAFAVDLGAGGKLRGFSNIGFGIERNIAFVSEPPGSAQPGLVIPVSVRVWGNHDHGGEDVDQIPLAGETVTFAVTGGGSVPPTATTNADGVATVSWTLGTAPGANSLRASVPGVAQPQSATVAVAAGTPGPTAGTLLDPSGDASSDYRVDAPAPDLTEMVVSSANGTITFSLVFAQGAFSPAYTHATLPIGTGQAGLPSDPLLAGTNFLVQMGANFNGARVAKATGAPNGYTQLGVTYPVTYRTDGRGMSTTIPLSAFNDDDGLLAFRAQLYLRLSPSAFSGVLDSAGPAQTAPVVVIP